MQRSQLKSALHDVASVWRVALIFMGSLYHERLSLIDPLCGIAIYPSSSVLVQRACLRLKVGWNELRGPSRDQRHGLLRELQAGDAVEAVIPVCCAIRTYMLENAYAHAPRTCVESTRLEGHAYTGVIRTKTARRRPITKSSCTSECTISTRLQPSSVLRIVFAGGSGFEETVALLCCACEQSCLFGQAAGPGQVW